MIKRQKNNLGILAIILLLCLATLSTGYSGWSDTVIIKGTVNIGYTDVNFLSCTTNDLDGSLSYDPIECGIWDFNNSTDPGAWNWIGTRSSNDSGSINCQITNSGDLLEITAVAGQTGEVTSPGYCGQVAYTIANDGSIPVKIQGIKLVKVSRDSGVPISMNLVLDQPKYVYFQDDGAGGLIPTVSDQKQHDPISGEVLTEFSINLTQVNIGQQIEPDGMDGDWISSDICFCVYEGAETGAVYDFVIEVIDKQWNIVP